MLPFPCVLNSVPKCFMTELVPEVSENAAAVWGGACTGQLEGFASEEKERGGSETVGGGGHVLPGSLRSLPQEDPVHVMSCPWFRMIYS